MSDPRPLISAERIATRVAELGRRISSDHAASGELCLIGVMKGAFMFLADLARAISIPTRVDFVTVASYGDSTSPGEIRILADTRAELAGRHVLLVDDIVDSGGTLEFLVKSFVARNPASLRTCVLTRKRTERTASVEPDYLGFDVPDAWIVGYGLDRAGSYRSLPYIATFDPPPS